jgi:hypothetical protein
MITDALAKDALDRLSMDRAMVIAFNPAIEDASAVFENSIFESKYREPWYTYRKLADLLEWLNQTRPQSIFELGSGLSSLILASWAKKHAAEYLAFEEDAKWCSLVRRAVDIAGGRGEIRIIPAVDVADQGRKFGSPLPGGIDLIYLDGPSGLKPRRFNTQDGNAIFFDVPHYLEKGQRPTTIIVDGRSSTVRYISGMHAASMYRRTLAGIFLQAEHGPQGLSRHTSFVLATDPTSATLGH